MKKFKVLITDNISQEGIDILLREKNIDVDIKAGIKNDDLKKIIGNYDAMITRSGTTIPATLIENTREIKNHRPRWCWCGQHQH